MMYGYLGNPQCFGVKLLSLYPENPRKGLSSHLGLLILYETDCGKPLAIMDGSVITAKRTSAATAVATDKLARRYVDTLTIMGGGEQAESHLLSILEIRKISHVYIWCRSQERADQFVEKYKNSIEANIEAISEAEKAVRRADIVCTVTSSPTPVLKGKWVQPGTHINLVGSSIPENSEADSDLVIKSRYFVDYRQSTLAQAGEYLLAVRQGLIDETHIVAEIGEVIAKTSDGRKTDDEITVYKSLGVIAQDLICASAIYKLAQAQGAGYVVDI